MLLKHLQWIFDVTRDLLHRWQTSGLVNCFTLSLMSEEAHSTTLRLLVECILLCAFSNISACRKVTAGGPLKLFFPPLHGVHIPCTFYLSVLCSVSVVLLVTVSCKPSGDDQLLWAAEFIKTRCVKKKIFGQHYKSLAVKNGVSNLNITVLIDYIPQILDLLNTS